MEKLIAQTITQRNFEMNQLQNPNREEAEKWLQSVKMTNKITPEEIKYIKIGEQITTQTNEAIELPVSKKQLSWAPELEENNVRIDISESIFDKLKPLSESDSDIKAVNRKIDLLLEKMDKFFELLAKTSKNNI
jgi:hypothetical protein